MVRRRVRAMLPRSVLLPVSISRAVFGHKNTNSPMGLLRGGPAHSSFGPHGKNAAADEGCGNLWITTATPCGAASVVRGVANQCRYRYAATSRASCSEIQ